MAERSPRRDLTPCYISRRVTVNIDAGRGERSVPLHSRETPCGHAFRGGDRGAVPTFREWVEDWVGDRDITVRPCEFCGGLL